VLGGGRRGNGLPSEQRIDSKKGYTPRVLIYSTATQNSTRTVAPKVQALLEHSDGIRCMAFSPCSKYLVSVGTVHDQCIIVYKLNVKNNWVKIAAAKFKDIIDSVIWSKRRIIKVGRRHLRVWEWHENSVCDLTS
jgi:WD40 repeat protein